MAYGKNKGEPKEFSCRVIDLLKDMPSDRGDGGTVLQVEAWSVNGKEGKPAFAKRDYWNNETGKQTGKAKGFNQYDIEFFLKNIMRITRHFGYPPQIVRELVAEGMGELQQETVPPQEQEVQEAADPWKQ